MLKQLNYRKRRSERSPLCILDDPCVNAEALSKANILFEGVPCTYNTIKASLLCEILFGNPNVQQKATMNSLSKLLKDFYSSCPWSTESTIPWQNTVFSVV